MIFVVHKLAKFSSNDGKVHFKGLVHLLRCIKDNKTLVLNYYDDMKDAPLSYLSRKAIINTVNQLMVFYDYSQKDCPKTGRIIGAYIIFDQCEPIDNGTHVIGPVYQ